MLETTDGSGLRSLDYDDMAVAEIGTSYEEGLLAGWQIAKPRDAALRAAGWQVKQAGGVKASSVWGYLAGSGHLSTVSLGSNTATYGRVDVKSGHPNPAAFLLENGIPASLNYSGASLTQLRDEGMGEHSPRSSPGTTYYAMATDFAQGAVPLLDQSASRNEDGQMTNGMRTWNGDMNDRSLQDYGYNSRKEVVQAAFKSQVGALFPGRGFRYAYDALGNRTATSVSTLGAEMQAWLDETPGSRQTTSYPSTNSLNQYQTVQRPNPLKKLVQGLAYPESTVTVTLVGGPGNGTLPPVSTLRWGPGMTAFAAEAAVEMTPQAGWRRVRVDAVRPGAGVAGANLRTVREGWLYFPPSVETLAYDLDGNLISDARWTYGWDGENRLIWMEEKVIPGGGIRPARQRLEFGYDGQSRRVVKRVLQKVSETATWSLRQERRFLYDGWNMIAELDVPSSGAARVHRAYAWGLDASGTLTGAGGVGGLLLTSHHTPLAGGGTQVTTLAPLYDFNGNVLAYADVATSTITHRMEYDPFGQELSLDTLLPGDGAAEAPRFRFSTKYTDGETGLVYYGYRSYSPELGRWVNRDPIGERGGINLYGMVGNDAVNQTDYLGHYGQRVPCPAEAYTECDKICKAKKMLHNKRHTKCYDTTGPFDRRRGLCHISWKCGCHDPCKGLRDILADHEGRLQRYVDDPLGSDNKGHLQNALSDVDLTR